MKLGARLAAGYAVVIFVALLIFAAIAVFAIDRTIRSSVDSRLDAEAHAAASVVDIRDGAIVTDADDQRQFVTLLGAEADAAVIDAQGAVKISSAAHEPPQVLALPRGREAFYTGGTGENQFRALVLPVQRNGRMVGTVVVWRAIDWIGETDRGAAVAFAAGAFLIAILAMFAGGAVTRRALEEAFRRQRRFTADASHELRAPLAVIRAEADLALRRERSSAEYRTAFETVASEADHIEALIGDLLMTARVEDRSFTMQPVDVAQTLHSVAQRLAAAASAKSATIDVRSPGDLSIMGEPRSFERALLGITHNAVKFAPEHGHVWLEARDAGASVELTVRDDGPGFTKQALASALDRFWREDTARSREGSGLGLSIARSIVESFGGSVALENGGPGAIVRLRFPEP